MVSQLRAARPAALVVGTCLALMLAAWLLLGLQRAREDMVPPGATGVRVEYRRLTHVLVTYHAPAGWSLLDLYTYLEAQGWSRDGATERAMRQGQGVQFPPGGTFAIFERRGWFGQADEIAVVAIDPNGSALVHVRQVRCLPLADTC